MILGPLCPGVCTSQSVGSFDVLITSGLQVTTKSG